jgi:hypothetical protein
MNSSISRLTRSTLKEDFFRERLSCDEISAICRWEQADCELFPRQLASHFFYS